jgi:alpha-galactosidase
LQKQTVMGKAESKGPRQRAQTVVHRMRLLLASALVGSSLTSTTAYNNGYGLKPFLGWQSWCAVGKCGTDACYDRQIRQTATAMATNGMKDLGFEWVVIDDCWHPTRDANGTLVPFEPYFPHGMKAVADFVHSLGLKFGLYTSVGSKTCHHGWSPGSFGHYQQDADLFASWGVDVGASYWPPAVLCCALRCALLLCHPVCLLRRPVLKRATARCST